MGWRVVTAVSWWRVWDCLRQYSRHTVRSSILLSLYFEEVRRWVEDRLYRCIEEKVEAVNAYLGQLESDPDRVRSLAGWRWMEDNVRFFQHTLWPHPSEMV